MDWEQIESKWQAMARRIRADLKDVKTPFCEAEPPKTETPRPVARPDEAIADSSAGADA